MADYPSVQYPKPYTRRIDQRQLFNDYGTSGAAMFLSTDKTNGEHWRTQFTSSKWKLKAQSPSLPLLPPNDAIYPLNERCMGEIKNRKKDILSAKSTLSYTYRNFRNEISNTAKLRRYIMELDAGDEYDSVFAPMFLKRLTNLPTLFEDSSVNFENVNSRYTGGCLSHISTSDKRDIILYPTGKHMDYLCLSELDLQETIPTGKILSAVQLTDSIYQISHTTAYDKVRCLIRSDNTCTELSLNEDTLKEERKYIFESCRPTSICLSNYVPGESVIATNKGSVYLWSHEHSEPREVMSDHNLRFKCLSDWRSVHYGAHPRSIVLTDRSAMELIDLRGRQTDKTLFSIPSDILMIRERIKASQQIDTFHHLVITDYSMLLIDQRYPLHPVIQWHHQHRVPPQYIDTLPNAFGDGNSLLVTATQDCTETFLYQYNISQTLPPQSVKIPLRVSYVDDFTREPAVCGRGCSKLLQEQRLGETCLLGVTVSKTQDSKISVLQLTSYGDVFQQTLIPEEGPADNTGIKAWKSMSDETVDYSINWLKQLYKQSDIKNLENYNDPNHYTSGSHILEVIKSNVYPHILCPLCIKQTSQCIESQREIAKDEQCYCCGNKIGISSTLVKRTSEDTIANLDEASDGKRVLSDQVKTIDYKTATDVQSRLITAEWNEENIDDLLKERDDLFVKLKKERREKWRQKRQEYMKKNMSMSESSLSMDIISDDDELQTIEKACSVYTGASSSSVLCDTELWDVAKTEVVRDKPSEQESEEKLPIKSEEKMLDNTVLESKSKSSSSENENMGPELLASTPRKDSIPVLKQEIMTPTLGTPQIGKGKGPKKKKKYVDGF